MTTEHRATIECTNYGEALDYDCSCGYIHTFEYPTSVADVLAVHENHLFVSDADKADYD